MIDPKLLRQATSDVAANLARRGYQFDADAYLALEERRKTLQIEMGERLANCESELQTVQAELRAIELDLPNLLDDSVPDGRDESDNVEVRKWGVPTELGFTPRDHIELGESLGMIDFDAASRISGSRFAVMKGPLARLQRALIQFMLDTHTAEHGYTETYVPYLVHGRALEGTGNLPKFEEDLFKIATEVPLYLPIDIGIFSKNPDDVTQGDEHVLLLEKHRVQDGNLTFELIVDEEPSHVGIDPYNKLIDRNSDDNLKAL